MSATIRLQGRDDELWEARCKCASPTLVPMTWEGANAVSVVCDVCGECLVAVRTAEAAQ